MNAIRYIIFLMFVVQILSAQNEIRDAILNRSDRKEIIKKQVERLSDKNEQGLIVEVHDLAAKNESRIAAAVLLLRTSNSRQAIVAALEVVHLEMPPGLNEWEEAIDWTLSHPVAGEVAMRPDLMPHVIQRTLDGALPESIVGFVLLRYQSDNLSPSEHLRGLLRTNLTSDQRRRCERLIAILKGETPPGDEIEGATERNGSNASDINLQSTGSRRKQSPETTPKQPTLAAENQPALLTRWGVPVAIVTALGLLCLLLIKRK